MMTQIPDYLSCLAFLLQNNPVHNYVVKPNSALPGSRNTMSTSIKKTAKIREKNTKPPKLTKAYLEAAALAFPPYPSFDNRN